ncbi:MAG: peptidoglycan DD-metalloendopeptidase family protein [Bacilli bacterium]|nr:peptidoglycan DD-metalloendopeptidase family protein [Bacilli bacterium]
MMKSLKYKVLLITSLMFVILPITVQAEELTFGKVLDDLAKAKAELNKNNQAINNSENKIDENNATIKSLNNQISEMSEEVNQLQQQIVDANDEIALKKEQIQNVIKYLQLSQGENLYFEYAFGAETITDFVYRISVVDQIAEHNNAMINSLQDLISQNEKKKVELANRQEDYKNKMSELDDEIKKLNNSISKLGESVPNLQQQVKSKQELVDYYKSQGCSQRGQVIGRDCAVSVSNGAFSRPMKTGYVTSWVGYRWGSLHRGLDLGSSLGRNTPLYSIGYGVITSVYRDNYGAKCVIIQYKLSNGQYYSALYAHLSKYGPGIYEGMASKDVTPNTIIGYMGDTGKAYGVHLHLEVWPCRLYGDSNCKNWDSYVQFVKKQYNKGFHGAEDVISFPNKTYTTWYSK